MATSKLQSERQTALQSAFLDRASQELLGRSPTISAYLGSLHLRTSELTPDATPQNLKRCMACGTILIPSSSCTRVKSPKRKRTSTANISTNDVREYACVSCGATSTFDTVPRRKLLVKSKSPPSKAVCMTPTTTAASPATAALQTDNKSTKPQQQPEKLQSTSMGRKRPKARKLVGLSGLLAQSKAQQPSTSDLDFMDFMKAG
ncbi:hypothetical protein K461DRAFT_297541 [Myriangium duriaei CBS 260.36]|uniref:Uncharacterized protein n=1 Tax=Myriangium duriaei CBS 260.36 TaxID=1168546 RepID=A0A9P4IYB8_9PEZI|nr:hypothetical protein K461DRAFT_297541 [Myriangium duriaei CBS 260.36]